MNSHGMARSTLRNVGFALVLAAILGMIPETVDAGENFAREAEAPAVTSNVRAGLLNSQVNWWSIPRSARVAAKNLAATQDATVTRCVAVDHNESVSYEIHAARRLGFLKKQDFVLTSISEPKAVADKRREEQTLRRRLARLREAATFRSAPPTGRQEGDLRPRSN